MNKIRTIEKINEAELSLGIASSASWHAEFAHSPYIYIGGLPYELTEGDIIVIFSQYGVVDAIKLHRDKDTGKSKGFAFLRYEDPRSCVLAVDNFNGTNILNRKVSVNHVKDYKNAEEMDIVAEQGEGEGSEDEKTKRDRRRKEKKTEARSVELMRAAMSQDSEEKQRAIDKERRRDERRRRERSHDERRDEEISHHQKMPKYETYESDMPHSYRDH